MIREISRPSTPRCTLPMYMGFLLSDEHFQAHSSVALQNHVFAAIAAYVQLQRLCFMDVLKNCYQVQRNLFNGVVAEFVRSFMPGKEHLNPQFCPAVNA